METRLLLFIEQAEMGNDLDAGVPTALLGREWERKIQGGTLPHTDRLRCRPRNFRLRGPEETWRYNIQNSIKCLKTTFFIRK